MSSDSRPRVVFHIPLSIDPNRASASNLRPVKMVEAFRAIGYDVTVVSGTISERREAMRRIKRSHRRGERFNFVYSESATMPTALTSRHHLPIAPFLDLRFLRWCRLRGVPVGLFYRDMYWQFDEYRNEVSRAKRAVARLFYLLDLLAYRRSVDVLFVPSMQMIRYSPIDRLPRVHELPPGSDAQQRPLDGRSSHQLRLVYVGGLNSHVRVDSLLAVVKSRADTMLTLCVREDDWRRERSRYESLLSDAVQVVHGSGPDLREIYEWSDIGVLYSAPTAYRNVAMPMKLFEYMSFGKPVLATDGSAAGDYVKKNDVGWAIPYAPDSLDRLLEHILLNPAELQRKAAHAAALAVKNTWERRAREVAQLLTDAG